MKNIILILIVLFSINSYSQINVLVHFTGKETAIKKAADSLHFSYVKLNRMNNVYSLVISSKEKFIEVRRLIKKSPNVTIIGGWNSQGKFLSFPNSVDNFSRIKFKNRLKKFIRRNKDGDIIEQRNYTNEELTKGVINQIYGWGKREF